MDKEEFFTALIASIRALGYKDLAYDEHAFVAGTEAAVDEATSQEIDLDFFSDAPVALTLSGLKIADDYKLLSFHNPVYERVSIRLANSKSAELFKTDFLPPNQIEQFKAIANAFIASFQEAAVLH